MTTEILLWLKDLVFRLATVTTEDCWQKEAQILLAILFAEAACFYLLGNSVNAGQSSITPFSDVMTKTAARGPFWSHS